MISNKQSSTEVIDMQTLDEMNKFVNILHPNFMLYMIARVHNYAIYDSVLLQTYWNTLQADIPCTQNDTISCIGEH